MSTDIQSAMQGVGSTAAVRLEFSAADVAEIDTLSFSMRYADGFVAYLNGIEVARRSAPSSLAFDSVANSPRTIQEVLQAERIGLDAASPSMLVDGTNVLAIHALNDSVADGTFFVSPELAATRINENQQSYFQTPTPGQPNRDAVLGLVDRVQADLPAGFYESTQTVSLSTTSSGASIRYTTDGTTPTATNGLLYTGPISITSTTNLRAVAYQTDYASQPSITRTYLFLDDVLNQSNDGSAPPGFPSTWKNNVVDYGIDPEVIAVEGTSRVKDALLALPTWSITTEVDNLFDPDFGIYSNASQDGRDWERPAAVELINPDGAAGFQVNAGLRIRGGFSRSDNNPKHALKLFFRGSYGDSSLNYPVNGDEGVSEFEKMDLRTAQNYSWSFSGSSTNNFVSEVMARLNQRELGQPYTRSTWIHLYLNGQYWGLYQTQERADANYAASYFGGEAGNYDVLKPERGAYQLIATDGNFDAYEALWQQAADRAPDGITPAFVDNAAYLRAQGLNPDGSENLSYDVLLDVDNTIAYMIETIRGGNLDAPISNFLGNNRPNNYFAIRDRTGREGFRFIQHDAEHTHRNVNENRNGPYNHPNFEGGVEYFNPQWLHQQLMANDEYRLRFADKVQSAFFADGPLTAEAQIALLRSEAAKIDLAVVAESARWGDAKVTTPFGRNDFLNALDALEQNYFPQRSSIVVNQFRSTQLVLKDSSGDYTVAVAAPLFPDIDAPQILLDGISSRGGEVAIGTPLDFASPDGVVYYTTDGSDPRLFGGAINPNALIYDPMSTSTTAIATGSSWRYRDTGENLGTAWRSTTFDDTAWSAGNGELGYGDGDEATVVGFGDANNKFITTYFRRDFTVDPAAGQVFGVTLRLKRDDGAAVYINGVEVVRDNLPAGPLSDTTPAITAVGNAAEDTYFEFAIDPATLQAGGNVIAVEVHQSSGTSSDLSFDAELIVDQQQASPITVSDSVRLTARTRSSDGTWSAVEGGLFTVPLVPASSQNLRVTELHYHPSDPPSGLTAPLDDNDSYEFIELRNVGVEPLSLQGVRFTAGISFDFTTSPKLSLQPGELIVLVASTAAMGARYGTGLPIAGEYTGRLSNGGERITIVGADDVVIQSFAYVDDGGDWHDPTDGGGPSLTVLQTSGDYDLGTNWRPSYVDGGTPGVDEPTVTGPTVVGRHVAYAGATASYGPLAVASDVTPLQPGFAAVAANVSGYVRGLNRIVIDVESLTTTTLSASDFTFRVGNSNDLVTWTPAPAPTSIQVLPGVGAEGSGRIVITWPDNVIQDQWLETTVLSSGTVGVATDDVFYFGNQVADTNGADPGELVQVDQIDSLRVKYNLSTSVEVDITNDYDVDRNGYVNEDDEVLVRDRHVTGGRLQMIGVVDPASPAVPIVIPAAPHVFDLENYRDNVQLVQTELRAVQSRLRPFFRSEVFDSRTMSRQIQLNVRDFQFTEEMFSVDAIDAFFAGLNAEVDAALPG